MATGIMMIKTDKQKITLYCLPFAGGHAHSYRDFQAHMADFIFVKALDLPGRGRRLREPLLIDIEAMADDVFHRIQADIDGKPYAIYGHSMGALLGNILTKRILSTNLSAPLHLFFSGREASSICEDSPKHNLSEKAFIAHLHEMGGFPSEILTNTALMEFFEPILRADFKASETYIYKAVPPFDIPITLLHGMNDKEYPYADLFPWQQETRQPISIKQFPGDHFFIFEHLFQIGQLISKTLAKVRF
jgi:surfactin synthase thioesterase subunit